MKQRRLRTLALAGVAGIALSACAPDLGAKPGIEATADLASQRSLAALPADWPDDAWWKSYGDPQLDKLIDQAIAGSPDLAIAEARLHQADAAVQQSGAAQWPTLSGNGSLQETKQSINQGFPPRFKFFIPRGWYTQTRITGNLDYQLDFFGKNRAALAAATSDRQAAAVDVAAAKLVISTAVASAYADLVRLEADSGVARDAVRVRQQSAELVGQREKQGLENAGQLDQARAEVASAQADADDLEGQVGRKRNEIAALLGAGPDRGLVIAVPGNVRLKPFGLPATLAVDLVGRRPDLVAARLRAEAAAHRVDVAHADFYPNIDIGGSLGLQSLGLDMLLQHGSIVGAIGPALHLPIFDGGKIEGAYRGSRAQYDEAVANYDKTLTTALHDVADAVVDQRTLARELAHSRTALGEAENSYRIAKLRYRGGLSRYLDVLTAEDTVLVQRRRVVDLEAQAFTQDVALVRALGGGFV